MEKGKRRLSWRAVGEQVVGRIDLFALYSLSPWTTRSWNSGELAGFFEVPQLTEEDEAMRLELEELIEEGRWLYQRGGAPMGRRSESQADAISGAIMQLQGEILQLLGEGRTPEELAPHEHKLHRLFREWERLSQRSVSNKAEQILAFHPLTTGMMYVRDEQVAAAFGYIRRNPAEPERDCPFVLACWEDERGRKRAGLGVLPRRLPPPHESRERIWYFFTQQDPSPWRKSREVTSHLRLKEMGSIARGWFSELTVGGGVGAELRFQDRGQEIRLPTILDYDRLRKGLIQAMQLRRNPLDLGELLTRASVE